MSIAVLSCILGKFDTPVDPVPQTVPFKFHRWTDEDYPPILGLTPRMQYRIPKTHGWKMLPGYDYYIWLDGAVSFKRDDCIQYYLNQLDDADMAFFKHPTRRNVRQEVAHIEEHLQQGKPYITARYKDGLHKEQMAKILEDSTFKDRHLWASTGFIYRNTKKVQDALVDWWEQGTLRYFTCDQVVLPYIVHKHKLKVNTMNEPVFKSGYISLTSHHR